MTYLVRFGPEALDQLLTLRQYISAAAMAAIAEGYVDAIVSYCEGLGVFPHSGTARDDIRPGLGTSSYKKRVVVAYAVGRRRSCSHRYRPLLRRTRLREPPERHTGPLIQRSDLPQIPRRSVSSIGPRSNLQDLPERADFYTVGRSTSCSLRCISIPVEMHLSRCSELRTGATPMRQ